MARFFRRNPKKKSRAAVFSVRWAGALQKLLRALLPYVLSLVGFGVLFGTVIAYAVNSSAFQLAEVKILNAGAMTPDQAFRFCELKKGENLVTLDLVGVQQVIKRRHPEFNQVRVQRVLPNRIQVQLKRRTPVAQVALARYVQIDRDRVVLPGSSPTAFKNLTILEGVPMPRGVLWVGQVLGDPMTQKAAKILDLVRRSQLFKNHALTKVDIGDPKNVVLVVDGSLEIRLGDRHLVERLKILQRTLKTMELDVSKIRYIDLRFDDVVIGPR